MENFTLLSEAITPEIAVLLRAALVAALLFGLETLGNARRKAARAEVTQAERPERRLVKKRIVKA